MDVLFRDDAFAPPAYIYMDEMRRLSLKMPPLAVWTLLNTATVEITGTGLTRWRKLDNVVYWSPFPKLEFISEGSYHCLERFVPTGNALGDYDVYCVDGTAFSTKQDPRAVLYATSLARVRRPVILINVSGYYPQQLPYLKRFFSYRVFQ